MDKCVSLSVMSRGNHIVALDAAGPEARRDEFLLTEEIDQNVDADISFAPADDWDAEEPVTSHPWRDYAAPAVAGLAVALWTGAFGWSKFGSLTAPPSFDQGLSWVASWSVPVLLICVIWLLAMRMSRREAGRFGDAARLLGAESNLLSERLTSVNSELSMARDFIAAQARDLESLGRVAVERLSQNAESLQSLIQSNSAQIESIHTVSSAALDNMEKLRGQLPVITNSARDLTSNIGNAGRTAHAQLQEMIAGFRRINEFGQASERQVEALRKLVGETLDELLTQSSQIGDLTERRFDGIIERGEAFRSELDDYQSRATEGLKARSEELTAAMTIAEADLEKQQTVSLARFRARIDELLGNADAVSAKLYASEQSAAEALSARMRDVDTEIALREERQLDHIRSADTHSLAVANQLTSLESRLAEIASHAEATEQRLSGGVTALTDHIAAGRAALKGADGEIAALTESSIRLLELIQAGSQHSREHIPAALADAELRLESVEKRIGGLRNIASEVATIGEQLQGSLQGSQDSLISAASDLETLHIRLSEQTGSQTAALETMRQALTSAAAQSGDLGRKIETELVEAVDRAVDERGAAIASRIDQASQRATDAGREVTMQLRDQLAKVDELAGNLERRVAHARERAEERIENDFARRVALITESLNSNAIDIARALDSEVSDTSWASYLKGDRGIFTRRAVSLLEGGEAKAILQVYEDDTAFHDHVNLYIHDFEAMLRQILSTRDGNALGVTLLSSDMGKLYVALAQAIERLRR